MDLPQHDIPDTPAQRARDRGRVLRAFNASLAAVLLLTVVFFSQNAFDAAAFAVAPHEARGLIGLLSAPLLHGGFKHLTTNGIAILMLGTLAGSVYPKATLRALPLLWIGSGLGAWLLGEAGQRHLGASGVTHGLGFLLFVLGLLRRDRAAVAAGMLAFLFYGGMVLTVLPQEPGVSWQSHLGGALGGILGALLFRRADPLPPRRKYSWEIEEEQARLEAERAMLEPPRPDEVPVIWHRPQSGGDENKVLPFRRPDDGRGPR
ncbi:rhomboid family intramembrane serine protease [Lysobacter pythonis]|uniref:Rhomboid family intramembrane serine protease n=1 Tax=Solilutibacter pythonis TaxID=2483112 RepID=A0A3M2HVX7_9GAMM|nr:rhomboid family intramembrane serine protease [Lysobacter pythonis]RMH93896.1 rhomboid family intramembrane serine protease [Lysobacter pythonis]